MVRSMLIEKFVKSEANGNVCIFRGKTAIVADCLKEGHLL